MLNKISDSDSDSDCFCKSIAMCSCIIIAVLIYHDVIIQILPSISMWLDTHIGLKRPHF